MTRTVSLHGITLSWNDEIPDSVSILADKVDVILNQEMLNDLELVFAEFSSMMEGYE